MDGERARAPVSGGVALLLTSSVLVMTLSVSVLRGAVPPALLFETSDRCVACHNGLSTSSGEDVSIGYDWRASMMANSARDPYWQASVRREVMDFPGESEIIQDECAKCHMPMARTSAAAAGKKGSVFQHLPAGESGSIESRLAIDGVSCSMCHQIGPERLGTAESETGGYHVDITTGSEQRVIYGPFSPDSGLAGVMHSASSFSQKESKHIQTSEFCAVCHTLRTHALGPGAGAILPEQTPYREWLASSFAPSRSCQSCHMPEVAGEVAVSSVLGQPRANVSRHTFIGGNFFMLRMLLKHRGELGVEALPQELDVAISRTIDHLQSSTARIAVAMRPVQDGRLRAEVQVTNMAGHKLPTAYPSRRAWLHVTVRDASGATVFESGAFTGDGSIAGNDADSNPLAYEPHYDTIDRPDQVQIYESVMADSQNRPTTGLLTAVRYLKDNRLLPEGFNRASAPAEVAVIGHAAQDPNFASGSDRVVYEVDVRGRTAPFSVQAELWYQPIAFRWARNLAAYDAPEPRRFVRWFDDMAANSAVVLARGASPGAGGDP